MKQDETRPLPPRVDGGDSLQPLDELPKRALEVPGGVAVTGGVYRLFDDFDRFRHVLRDRGRRGRRRMPAAYGRIGGPAIPFVIAELLPGFFGGGDGSFVSPHTIYCSKYFRTHRLFIFRKTHAHFLAYLGHFSPQFS